MTMPDLVPSPRWRRRACRPRGLRTRRRREPDGSSPHYRRSRWYAGTDSGAQIGIQPLTAPVAPFKFIVHAAKAKAGLPVRGGIAGAAGWA